MNAIASHTASQLGAMSQFGVLRRRTRDGRRSAQGKLAADTENATAAGDRRDEVAGRVERLRHKKDALERFEAAEGWRRDEIPRLQGELDHHWAEVVAQCARSDDPLAFGVDKLRHARSTTAGDFRDLNAGIPADRGGEAEQARVQLTDALRRRHDAEQALADSWAKLQEASRRRWGRHDNAAMLHFATPRAPPLSGQGLVPISRRVPDLDSLDRAVEPERCLVVVVQRHW